METRELSNKYGTEITTEGKCHLGAAIGKNKFKNEYLHDLVISWRNDIKFPAEIARYELQSAYAAMAFAVQHKWKLAQKNNSRDC